MNKSVKLAVQLSLGVFCFLGFAGLVAQEESVLTPADIERDGASVPLESAPESVDQTIPKENPSDAPVPGNAEALPQTEATTAADEGAQLGEDPLAANTATSEPQPYWTPEAEPPIFVDTADVAPVEFKDQTTVSSALAEEEPEETALYGNLWSMSGANAWHGNTIGAAGFAPIAPPSGFNTPPAAYHTGRGGDSILRGFGLAVNLSGTYDSNVTQSSGAGWNTKTDDFITSLGGSLSYMSQADVWTFGGSYTGAYNFYESNSDFNGYTQGGSLIANYNGAKLSATLATGLSTGRGGNRYLGTSDFVEQDQINVSLVARYVYSPKTILTADAGHGFTSTSGGNFSDTNASYLGFAALWRYSPLTEFGPGIRFTQASGGGSNTRTSFGPTLNLNYRYSSKLSLTSQLGLDFADYSQIGSSEASVSASLGLNYQASPLWGMNLSLFRNSQADPSVSGSFREVTAVRLGYTRKIRRATLGLGLSYENSTASNGGVVGTRPDRDYFSVDGSLGMRIFANTTDASIFMRYSDQSASNESFEALQVGFMLSRGF